MSDASSQRDSPQGVITKSPLTTLSYSPKRKMSVISFEATGFTSTLTHMKKKIEELTNKNASTKILLYMVIHDLKHPTEALIENVNRMTQLLHFTQTQLAQALLENNEL